MISPSLRFRKIYESVLGSALDSVKPQSLIFRNLSLAGDILKIRDEPVDLHVFETIHVMGLGKGAPDLCRGIIEVFGEKIMGGIIISMEEHRFKNKNILSLKGDHPVPGENSIRSGQRLLKYTENLGEKDLVLGLITGGSSAMILNTPEGIGFNDVIKMNKLLISSGAGIDEINCVRKHLSMLKGGRLAKKIYPASLISFYISDVIGSDLQVIGSGVFSGDDSTYGDALGILQKYSIIKKTGTGILGYLQEGASGKREETPSTLSQVFLKNRSYIIGENIDALKGARIKGEEYGIKTEILTSEDSGDVHDASKRYGQFIKNKIKKKSAGTNSKLFLAGGEFTVNVKGKGSGGRVQEFLLSLILELKDIDHPFFIAGAGTDGRDGPTDAAGAWIDENTFNKCGNDPEKIISGYLKNNDSYNFFKGLGQLIHAGHTGTNVMDIYMFFLS